MAFVTVATLEQLREGSVLKIQVADRELLIFSHGTGISALSARCTHLQMSLPIHHEHGVVTCMFHGAEFELLTGHCRYFPNSRSLSNSTQSHDLQTFPVQILENRVQVDCG